MKRENEENQEEQNTIKQEEPEVKSENTNENQDQKEEIIKMENVENNLNDQNQDNGPINPPKRQRRSNDEEIRLLIPSKMAGAIIGKGGKNIQKVRADYNAQVNIGDCQGPERVLTISSSLDTCCTIIREIMKHSDKKSPDEFELRLLIHQSLAGCVIGKNGAKIRELKDKFQCRLKVFGTVAPQSTDRIIQFIGRENQCMDCLTEIINLMKSTPIKGQIEKYNPHNFDDYYADEYGGYGSGINNNTNNSNNNNFRMGNNRFGNDRGVRMRPASDRRSGGGNRINGNTNNINMRTYVDPWAINMNGNNQMGGMNNFLMSNGPSNGVFGNNGQMNETTSTQVTIPKDLAGAIIGKGGNKIRKIRSESNAVIQIDEAMPGSSERIITISGTTKQIHAAQYLLQQSVRNAMK